MSSKTTYIPYTKEIHEHKAPTDESIRLAIEMEEKVKKNILRTIIIKTNLVNGSITVFENKLNNSVVFCVRFILNGQEYFIEHSINKNDYINEYMDRNNDDYTMFFNNLVMREISVLITQELLSNVIEQKKL